MFGKGGTATGKGMAQAGWYWTMCGSHMVIVPGLRPKWQMSFVHGKLTEESGKDLRNLAFSIAARQSHFLPGPPPTHRSSLPPTPGSAGFCLGGGSRPPFVSSCSCRSAKSPASCSAGFWELRIVHRWWGDRVSTRSPVSPGRVLGGKDWKDEWTKQITADVDFTVLTCDSKSIILRRAGRTCSFKKHTHF